MPITRDWGGGVAWLTMYPPPPTHPDSMTHHPPPPRWAPAFALCGTPAARAALTAGGFAIGWCRHMTMGRSECPWAPSGHPLQWRAQRGFGGGGVRGSSPPPPPPPSVGAEFLEALKKIFGLNRLAPKAPEKIFDRPKARRKIWSNILSGLGGGGGIPPPIAPLTPVVPGC